MSTPATSLPETSAPPLDILDSVCVLYFSASGQTQLLVDILTAANYTILLPSEVLAECEERAEKNGWNIAGLYPFLGGPITKIDPITVAKPRALAELAKIRRGHPKGLQGSANLGECVCITHAVGAHRAGRAAVVSIDDLDGQTLANSKRVDYITIEDMLITGVDKEVITKAQARKAYEKMVPFGSSLPSWAASELKRRLGAPPA